MAGGRVVAHLDHSVAPVKVEDIASCAAFEVQVGSEATSATHNRRPSKGELTWKASSDGGS